MDINHWFGTSRPNFEILSAAEKALDRLVDELIDVPRGELLTLNDLVMRTLVDYAESAPDLDRFARLLDCIGARAYAAKVRSRIDTLQQRDRDRHLWSHEAADYGAALCVSDGGADVGERVRRIEADLASLEGMAIPAKRARLDCLHDLALLHRAARRFDDARAYFSKALDAADACGGPARGVVRTDQGRTRVIQRRFNVSVPRACVPEKHPRVESAPRDDRSSKS